MTKQKPTRLAPKSDLDVLFGRWDNDKKFFLFLLFLLILFGGFVLI